MPAPTKRSCGRPPAVRRQPESQAPDRQPRPVGHQRCPPVRTTVTSSRRRPPSSTRRRSCRRRSRPGGLRATSSRSCASRARAPTGCLNSTSSRRPLSILQGKGFRVALVTDGRMSGASGKVPAAIHVTPEACPGAARQGAAGRRDSGSTPSPDRWMRSWTKRPGVRASRPRSPRGSRRNAHGLGRDLFGGMRRSVLTAEEGACTWLQAGGGPHEPA